MYRILVAEDNPADVYLIRAALAKHAVDLPLQVAPDGSAALQILGEQETLGETELSLIILDLNLPRHDGIEILERIRNVKLLAGVPVAILTSSDSPRDQAVTSALGAACFLRKPSKLEQFLSLGAVFKELLSKPPAPTA
jgi:CheY-like chemotaxis protein